MALACLIYRLTSTFPRSEVFGLVSQMRRCAVSIPSNIAEGQGRVTDRNFAQFLGQARGSLNELATQVELASRLEYLSEADAGNMLEEMEILSRMLNALLKSVLSGDHRGASVR